MPANSRWDLIRRLRVNCLRFKNPHGLFLSSSLGYLFIYFFLLFIYVSAETSVCMPRRMANIETRSEVPVHWCRWRLSYLESYIKSSGKYLSIFRRVIMPWFLGSTRFVLVLVDPLSVYHLTWRNISKHVIVKAECCPETRGFWVVL